jgi:hypothetical protein
MSGSSACIFVWAMIREYAWCADHDMSRQAAEAEARRWKREQQAGGEG